MILTEEQMTMVLCILQTGDSHQDAALPGILAEIDAQDHLGLLPLGCTFRSCLGLSTSCHCVSTSVLWGKGGAFSDLTVIPTEQQAELLPPLSPPLFPLLPPPLPFF